MDIFNLPTVGVERFDRRTFDCYRTGIEHALDHLGGLAKYVKPGQKVLLKPDLMYDYPGDCGLVTSAEFIAAVGRMVKELGGDASIGDSPFILRGRIEDFWRRNGLHEVARRDGLELVNFEMASSRAVAVETRVFYISKAVLEADLVINLPRLKRDSRTGYAAAIRNMLGTIPGFQKGRIYQESHGGRRLAGILVDLFSVVRPALTIMEADPSGLPSASQCAGDSFVVASDDAVAVDTIAAEILGIAAHKAYTARIAGDAGMGINWLEGIKLRGATLSKLSALFDLDSRRKSATVFERVARGIVEPYVWLRSSINGELCDGCGSCVESCPTSALKMVEGARTPSINSNLCIGCWAGLTNCPTQAIYLQGSRLVNRLYPA